MNGISKFLILSIVCFVVSPVFCGCKKQDDNMIHWQSKASKVKTFARDKQGTSVTKASNGVIIIKDNSTTNKAGVNFGDWHMPESNIGEIRFDAEHFKTRYWKNIIFVVVL